MRPIYVAGDLFNSYNEPVAIVNRLIDYIKDHPDPITIGACAGNHDLPNHNILEVERSAFYNLGAAGAIRNGLTLPVWDDYIQAGAFSCGWDFNRHNKPSQHFFNIAVIHRYLWTGDSHYPGASIDDHISNLPDMSGWKVALFGDNHQQFAANKDGCMVINPGCLIRRRIDERHLQPFVGLLYSDANIHVHHIDCSGDKWRDNLEEMEADLAAAGINAAAFLETFNRAENTVIDYERAVEFYLREQRCKPAIVNRVVKIMEAIRCRKT